MIEDRTTDHGLLHPGSAPDYPLTVIISDTHLAGGSTDPLEDHVWRGSPLARFIRQLLASDEGQSGAIELILNGDFLEFVQAAPEMYTPVDTRFWCSQDESRAKLEVILDGHAEVFTALLLFQETGNAVTVMAGNHDVDLYWPQVRQRLRERAGPLRFELGEDWFSRYGGRLHIAHGHQLDPANRFEHWQDPVRVVGGRARLENCPGTRFVVGFVNPMDARFPFVDNIKPLSRMVDVLLRQDLQGAGWASIVLLSFLSRERGAVLGSDRDPKPTIERAEQALAQDLNFAEAMLAVYRQVEDPTANLNGMREALRGRSRLETFLGKTLDQGRLPDLPPVPQANTRTLSPNATRDKASTLGLVRERCTDVVADLRAAARERSRQGAQVIVCGHTHVPEEIRRSRYVYFNTGSWTRYLRVDDEDTLTLEQLSEVRRFPYELWSVAVREGEGGRLHAERSLFERSRPGF